MIHYNSSMKDYYKILGVQRTATTEQIRTAYRERAKRFHPDVDRTPGANARFQLIGEAYQTLVDYRKKRQYDIKLKYGIETKPQFRNREYSKRYGRSYRRTPGTNYHYDFFRSKKKPKKSKKTIYFDNTLFIIMVIIGAIALFFSIKDIFSSNPEIIMNGIQGLCFGLTYLFVLIYGWRLYKRL
ncbi:MAG: J domain-containing protein [Bacteroidota bacterium]